VSTAGGDFALWRRDGKEMFFLGPDNMMMAARVNGAGAAFDVGDVKPLFRLPTMSGNSNYQYAVTGDGQRFVIAALVEQSTAEPVSVIVNWASAVRK
jgi:hypothetical protein